MGTQTEPVKKRAPTLYGIIVFKLLKGLLFAGLALTMYTLSDNNLPEELQKVLLHLRLNPERKFWVDLARQLGNWTEAKVVLGAAATLVYSMFSLVEGVGLMFRVSWAGWMAIGESIFFIPIEIYELVHRPPPEPGRHGHPILLSCILLLNIFIVWYLVKNRNRLFRHHEHS